MNEVSLIATLIEQIPSIGLAALFAVFAIVLIRMHSETNKVVMDNWKEWLADQNKKRDEAQERRDRSWREFLAERQTQGNEAMSQLTDEIREMSKLLAAMNTSLSEHDEKIMREITRPRPSTRKSNG